MVTVPESHRYLEKDLNDYLRLFYGNVSRTFSVEIAEGDPCAVLVSGEGVQRKFVYPLPDYGTRNLLGRRRIVKRVVMASVYRVLRELTGRRFPYGAFTGIRPTKQYYTVLEEGLDVRDFFLNFLDFDEDRFALVRDIVEAQRPVYARDPRNLDVYIGIPFCRGRCSYCSFVSCDITRSGEWEAPYVDALIREIEGGKRLLSDSDWRVRALYIGGGTPSAISKGNIRRILESAKGIPAPEFTFEAGRPDSIDRELLELLSDYGVTRVSVNPQSANDETLARIGRRHTFSQVLEAYALVRKFPFDVNMDLIMGLEGEGEAEFSGSLDAVAALRPENITVHALALKHGAKLRDGWDGSIREDLGGMSVLAPERLRRAGYAPYYMYRQKYSAGNLENAGYALPGKVCVYNVDNMEEIASVLAFGANSISKRVRFSEERIERIVNPKDIASYIQKIDRLLAEKSAAFRRERT